MIAIVGGLLAALVWGVSVLASSRSTKLVGGPQAAAGVHLIGIVLIGVLCIVVPPGEDVDRRAVIWALAGGVGTVIGSTLLIWSVRHGKIGVATPIVSSSGALAAVIAVLLGEEIELATAALLALTAVAVVVVAGGGDPAVESAPARAGRGVLALAGASCLGYAISSVATGKASEALALPWVILPSRILGVMIVAGPLLARSRFRITRAALPLVATTAVLDVAGYLAFAWGMQDGIAVTSVLAGLFAAVGAVGGWVLFRERLTRRQVAGIVVLLAAVTALAVVTA